VSTALKDGIPEPSVRLQGVLARLEGLIDWEKRARGGGMDVSLAPMTDLCGRLGAPERGLLAVHVAGSKGKGTTSALVASALRSAGLSVGLYTSPHVERVTERLTLDGREVDPERLGGALERVLAAREGALAGGTPAREATWFDCLTAAALLILREARVEVAVVECGLGGRLDSTNVLDGAVAAVTNVYLEHTSVLGTTRAAIAREKAGIVKPGVRVVVGALGPQDEAAAVVEAIARERGACVTRVTPVRDDPLEWRNLRLAAAILAELERASPGLAGRGGGLQRHLAARADARLPGRAERRHVGSTRVVLDGAHVPESLALIVRDLGRDEELARPPVVVFGCGREKNAEGLLKALFGRADRVLCSSVGAGLARDAAELAGLARALGLAARAVPEPAAALDEAVRVAGPGGWVLVTGSLHLVGALRSRTSS
jgi:dihydrofolate synthase/folylpolyglutamate synthase